MSPLLAFILPWLGFVLFFGLAWFVVDRAVPHLWRVAMKSGRKVVEWSRGRGLFERWSGRRWPLIRRLRPYAAVLLILAVGTILAAVVGDGFIDLTEQLRSNTAALRGADTQAASYAAEVRNAGATHFFLIFTTIGTPVGLGGLTAAVAILLWIRRRRDLALYLLVTVVSGSLLNLGLKTIYRRARPDLSRALTHATGYSFPSGHTMGSMFVFGALAFVALRALPLRRGKSAAVALALTMILAISASRVYLGVHWISDIAGGLTAGILWLTTTTVVYETMRRITRIRRSAGEDAVANVPGPRAQPSAGTASSSREGRRGP